MSTSSKRSSRSHAYIVATPPPYPDVPNMLVLTSASYEAVRKSMEPRPTYPMVDLRGKPADVLNVLAHLSKRRVEIQLHPDQTAIITWENAEDNAPLIFGETITNRIRMDHPASIDWEKVIVGRIATKDGSDLRQAECTLLQIVRKVFGPILTQQTKDH